METSWIVLSLEMNQESSGCRNCVVCVCVYEGCVLFCFIDPRMNKIRNEAFSCPCG